MEKIAASDFLELIISWCWLVGQIIVECNNCYEYILEIFIHGLFKKRTDLEITALKYFV